MSKGLSADVNQRCAFWDIVGRLGDDKDERDYCIAASELSEETIDLVKSSSWKSMSEPHEMYSSSQEL